MEKGCGERGVLGRQERGDAPGPAPPATSETPQERGSFWCSTKKPQNPGILAWEFSADKVFLVQEKAGVCLLYLANYQEVRNARWGGERSSHTHPGQPQAGEQNPCSFLGEELEIKPKTNKPGLIVQTLHLWQLCLGRGSRG